jgi:hypothetical protein
MLGESGECKESLRNCISVNEQSFPEEEKMVAEGGIEPPTQGFSVLLLPALKNSEKFTPVH